MKMNTAKAYAAIISFVAAGIIAAPAQTSEVDQLKAEMQTMQKNMDEMKQKIDELEKEKAVATAPGTNTTEGVTFAPPTEPVIGHAEPVADRGNMNDQQEAAPRLNDLTLDPKYYGFIPVPNTPALIKFDAKPRVDMMEDNRNPGSNPDRFVTATIPMQGTPGYGGGEQFNMTARGSQLSMDVRAPNMPGDFRFYYNNDFFGNGNGMQYRLKFLYGQFYNVTAGFTYSIFEDPDVWPDTVDFEGPNSMIFARQATVRYMMPLTDQWQVNFGVQQPSSDIDNEGIAANATGVNHLPDGGFNIRWEDAQRGHVQFATILRDVGANSPTLGQQNVLGWGLNLSTSLNVFENDSVQGQLTYGQGIFHFCNDNFTYTGFNGGDAAYNNAGELRALTYLAQMVGYTHQWSEKFRSTATFGHVNLQNEQQQTGAAYDETYYGSANLVWQLRKRLSVGFECLYGFNRQNSGNSGDVWRVQTGLVYSLF